MSQLYGGYWVYITKSHHWLAIITLLLFNVSSYIREKEMEEEALMQRREEEGKGRERRRALLEKEELKWKELEISLLSSIPNAGSRDAAAMAAAVRAVGGDSALEDSFARDRVSSIANHIRKAQLARRAEQVLFKKPFHHSLSA
jgi:transposase